MSAEPAVVGGIDEEDALMGVCACSATWRLAHHEVVARQGRWLDVLGVRCQRCGTSASFVFDITRFFQARPGVWTARSDRQVHQAWATA